MLATPTKIMKIELPISQKLVAYKCESENLTIHFLPKRMKG